MTSARAIATAQSGKLHILLDLHGGLMVCNRIWNECQEEWSYYPIVYYPHFAVAKEYWKTLPEVG